jgi:hypothetical protein
LGGGGFVNLEGGAVAKHHLIISGTGRAGTTFLVQLFTSLGLDTGFSDCASGIFTNCNAGMEHDIRQPGAPYVVKSPWLCDYLGDVLESGEIVVDHAIVPMRDLYAAAESRRDVVRREPAHSTTPPDAVAGGLWHTREPDKQEVVLAQQFHKLLLALAKHSIPTTLLFFPRFVKDPKNLYDRLRPLLGDITYESFLKSFQEVSRPELIHDFSH